MNVFIDTQIWVYAFKKPKREKFDSKEDYDVAAGMHNKAKSLIQEALTRHTIYITTHQLAELYHALAFRGVKLNVKEALNIVENIINSTRTVIVEVRRKHYREALRLSSLSHIHIWDYLCIVPLKDSIDVAYTNDKHFLHPTIKGLVPKIENPVNIWLEI